MNNPLKHIFFILYLFSFGLVHSQKLTLSELQSFADKTDWGYINNVLSVKGWDFYVTKNESEIQTVGWSYKKDAYEDRALAWLKFDYIDQTKHMISYQCNPETYNVLRTQLQPLGYKKINSSIKEGYAEESYESAKYLLTIILTKSNGYYGGNTIYKVIVRRKATGLDKLYYDNGNLKSECEYLNGVLNGVCKTYYENGNKLQVMNYVNDKLHGKYTEWSEDGNYILVTNYTNGVENGLSTKTYIIDSISIVVSGNNVNGKKNGKWTTTYNCHGVKKNYGFETYKNGVKHGNACEVDNEDHTVSYFNYVNGKKNGICRVYVDMAHPILGGVINTDTTKLRLLSRGNYINDEKSGKWYYEFISDYLLVETYLNNKKNGMSIIYQRDKSKSYYKQIVSQTNYVNGVEEGESIIYLRRVYKSDNIDDYDYEKCYISTNYVNGEKHGPYIEKDGQGRLIAKGKYHNGLRDGTWESYELDSVQIISEFKNDDLLSTVINYDAEHYDKYEFHKLTNSKWLLCDATYKLKTGEKFLCEYKLVTKAEKLSDLPVFLIPSEDSLSRHGRLIRYDSEGRIVFKSEFKNDKECAVSEYYLYDTNAILLLSHRDGDAPKAVKIDDHQPFTGTLMIDMNDGNRYIFFAKNGNIFKSQVEDSRGQIIGSRDYDIKNEQIAQKTNESQDSHHTGTLSAVDLGLSVEWADMNVDATEETDFGSYFAWAETDTKNNYTWTTYAHLHNKKLSKYNTRESSILNNKDDVASVLYGEDWRLPSVPEFDELKKRCKWMWFDNYKGKNVSGYKIIGPNGNSIFLPAGGHFKLKTNSEKNLIGYFWLNESFDNSSDNPNNNFTDAFCMQFDKGKVGKSHKLRFDGLNIRPVKKKKNNTNKR